MELAAPRAAGWATGPWTECMQGKGMVHLTFEKVEIYLWKIGFLDFKQSSLNAQWSYTIAVSFI